MPIVRRFGTFAVIAVQSEADFARLAWIATVAKAASL
jgi:hypothetical protein